MEKQFKKVIKEQDIKGLETLIKNGLIISELKLVDVFKIIYNSADREKLEGMLRREFIMILIENGIDIKSEMYSKNEIDIHIDIIRGTRKKEKVLLNCFQFAFWFYDVALIKYFIEQGSDVNQKLVAFRWNQAFQSWPLAEAYHHNDVELMSYLIQKEAKLHTYLEVYETIMHFKANKLLLESGIHPDTFRWNYSVPMVKALTEHVVDEYSYDHYSKEGENFIEELIEQINLFVSYGADVSTGCPINDILNSEHFTRDQKLELFDLFMKNGLDVNCRDSKKNTPLTVLPFKNYSNVFELDAGDNKKNEVFLSTIVTRLCKNGADINAKNYLGMTALMIASHHNDEYIVELLLEHGADINLKSEMTAYDLSSNEKIKKMISDTKNHNPQKLVQLLTNFTLDRPLKDTTHIWDFNLKKEYGDFDSFMFKMKNQFDSIKDELKDLSPNLHKKIEVFLLKNCSDEEYSWCSKANINMGWSSLEKLKEHCDSGKKPCNYKLPKPILLDRTTSLTTFGDVIKLFKQEIEIRRDFGNLNAIFENIQSEIGNEFVLSTQKLERQFYTDVEMFTRALDKIFDGIKKHSDYKEVEVSTTEFDDGSIELKIIHLNSFSSINAVDLFKESLDGDFADIREVLKNLCDWSVEGSFEDNHFRINYLKSNNVKDIVELDDKPIGFTHILKFYKW